MERLFTDIEVISKCDQYVVLRSKEDDKKKITVLFSPSTQIFLFDQKKDTLPEAINIRYGEKISASVRESNVNGQILYFGLKFFISCRKLGRSPGSENVVASSENQAHNSRGERGSSHQRQRSEGGVRGGTHHQPRTGERGGVGVSYPHRGGVGRGHYPYIFPSNTQHQENHHHQGRGSSYRFDPHRPVPQRDRSQRHNTVLRDSANQSASLIAPLHSYNQLAPTICVDSRSHLGQVIQQDSSKGQAHKYGLLQQAENKPCGQETQPAYTEQESTTDKIDNKVEDTENKIAQDASNHEEKVIIEKVKSYSDVQGQKDMNLKEENLMESKGSSKQKQQQTNPKNQQIQLDKQKVDLINQSANKTVQQSKNIESCEVKTNTSVSRPIKLYDASSKHGQSGVHGVDQHEQQEYIGSDQCMGCGESHHKCQSPESCLKVGDWLENGSKNFKQSKNRGSSRRNSSRDDRNKRNGSKEKRTSTVDKSRNSTASCSKEGRHSGNCFKDHSPDLHDSRKADKKKIKKKQNNDKWNKEKKAKMRNSKDPPVEFANKAEIIENMEDISNNNDGPGANDVTDSVDKMAEICEQNVIPIVSDDFKLCEVNETELATTDVNGNIEATNKDFFEVDNVEYSTTEVIGVDEPHGHVDVSVTGTVDVTEKAEVFVKEDNDPETDNFTQTIENKLKEDTFDKEKNTDQALHKDYDNNEIAKACRVHKEEGRVFITEVDLEFVKPNLEERHVVKMKQNDYVSIEHKIDATQLSASALKIDVHNFSNNDDASTVTNTVIESPVNPIDILTNEQNPIAIDTVDNEKNDYHCGVSEILEQQSFDDVNNMIGEELSLSKVNINSKFWFRDAMSESSMNPNQAKDESNVDNACIQDSHELSNIDTTIVKDIDETTSNQIEIPKGIRVSNDTAVKDHMDEANCGSSEDIIYSSQTETAGQETNKGKLVMPAVSTEESKEKVSDDKSNPHVPAKTMTCAVFDIDMVHTVKKIGDENDEILVKAAGDNDSDLTESNLSAETPEIKNNQLHQNGKERIIDNRQRLDSGVALDVSFETGEGKGVTNDNCQNSGVFKKVIGNILQQKSFGSTDDSSDNSDEDPHNKKELSVKTSTSTQPDFNNIPASSVNNTSEATYTVNTVTSNIDTINLDSLTKYTDKDATNIKTTVTGSNVTDVTSSYVECPSLDNDFDTLIVDKTSTDIDYLEEGNTVIKAVNNTEEIVSKVSTVGEVGGDATISTPIEKLPVKTITQAIIRQESENHDVSEAKIRSTIQAACRGVQDRSNIIIADEGDENSGTKQVVGRGVQNRSTILASDEGAENCCTIQATGRGVKKRSTILAADRGAENRTTMQASGRGVQTRTTILAAGRGVQNRSTIQVADREAKNESTMQASGRGVQNRSTIHTAGRGRATSEAGKKTNFENYHSDYGNYYFDNNNISYKESTLPIQYQASNMTGQMVAQAIDNAEKEVEKYEAGEMEVEQYKSAGYANIDESSVNDEGDGMDIWGQENNSYVDQGTGCLQFTKESNLILSSTLSPYSPEFQLEPKEVIINPCEAPDYAEEINSQIPEDLNYGEDSESYFYKSTAHSAEDVEDHIEGIPDPAEAEGYHEYKDFIQIIEEFESEHRRLEDKENVPIAVNASGDHIFPVDIHCPNSPATGLENPTGEARFFSPDARLNPDGSGLLFPVPTSTNITDYYIENQKQKCLDVLRYQNKLKRSPLKEILHGARKLEVIKEERIQKDMSVQTEDCGLNENNSGSADMPSLKEHQIQCMRNILLHIGYTEIAAKQHIKEYQQKRFIQMESALDATTAINNTQQQPLGYNNTPQQPLGYNNTPQQPLGYNNTPQQPLGYNNTPKQPLGYNNSGQQQPPDNQLGPQEQPQEDNRDAQHPPVNNLDSQQPPHI